MATSIRVTMLVYLSSTISEKEIITGNEEAIKVITFDVAHNYKKKDSNVVDWYSCEYYNSKFDVSWLEKGKQILLYGTMRLESYTTNNGIEKVIPKIIVQDIVFCGKKTEN